MKRGEQQSILHSGSKNKVNVFITILSSEWNQIYNKQNQKHQ
jgi:hypothetical protein